LHPRKTAYATVEYALPESDPAEKKEAKKRGRVRLEGKEYPVQDGDIISFRFNV
jgi:ribosome-binding ATPase YchF (GTP1/OBG family)